MTQFESFLMQWWSDDDAADFRRQTGELRYLHKCQKKNHQRFSKRAEEHYCGCRPRHASATRRHILKAALRRQIFDHTIPSGIFSMHLHKKHIGSRDDCFFAKSVTRRCSSNKPRFCRRPYGPKEKPPPVRPPIPLPLSAERNCVIL